MKPDIERFPDLVRYIDEEHTAWVSETLEGTAIKVAKNLNSTRASDVVPGSYVTTDAATFTRADENPPMNPATMDFLSMVYRETRASLKKAEK